MAVVKKREDSGPKRRRQVITQSTESKPNNTRRRSSLETTEELIRRFISGDQSAFHQIDGRFRPQVERFIRTRVYRNLPDAEDVIKEITQETMSEAAEILCPSESAERPRPAKHRFDPSRPFIPWLLGVAKKCANRYFERRPPDTPSQKEGSRVSPETTDEESYEENHGSDESRCLFCERGEARNLRSNSIRGKRSLTVDDPDDEEAEGVPDIRIDESHCEGPTETQPAEQSLPEDTRKLTYGDMSLVGDSGNHPQCRTPNARTPWLPRHCFRAHPEWRRTTKLWEEMKRKGWL